VLPPLGVFLLWTGVEMSARRFPSEFDWRYMTMSVLVSPRDNPPGRAWAAAGIGLCGLAILAWTIALGAGRSARPERDWRPDSVFLLRWGGVCMVGAGLLPLRLPGIPKAHEFLTLMAFAGLCVGLLRLTLDVIGDSRGPNGHVGSRTSRAGVALAALLVAPIVIAGLAQLYVFYVLPELHWVGLSWRARGVPVYLSFAFWEWVTIAVLSVYLVTLGIATRAPSVGPHQPTTDR
jgi:hypothetical protein